MTVPIRSATTSRPRRIRCRLFVGITNTNLPRNLEPSLELDDHPGLPEDHQESRDQRTDQGELYRPHADAQNRVGMVDVDVTSHVVAIDDARPLWIPALQDPGLDPTGEAGLPKQISHDVWTLCPNVRHLPHALLELWTAGTSVLPRRAWQLGVAGPFRGAGPACQVSSIPRSTSARPVRAFSPSTPLPRSG